MKKIFFLFIVSLASWMTYAYDVTNFFTAYSADGKYYVLDSVKMDNVTQGWSRTIDCSADTSVNYSVRSSLPTGMDDVLASSSENGLISNYRNYSSNHCFTVNIDHAGLLSIRAIDILGRTIVSHEKYCEEGSYHFQLSLSLAQPFILSVTTANASASMMLQNTSNAGNNTIACENIEPICRAPLRQKSEYELCEGDQINYIGYSHRQGLVIISQVVTIYVRFTDELIFFIFQSAVHSNEGSYVGLIGFNNQLYSKPIGLLTGENLSQYTSFIDNLSTANGTILAHAVNSALDSMELSPIPTKLNDVTLVTFTDGLDVGSWRMNRTYSSSAQYLQAVSNRIGRTCIDGSRLTSYAIGIKGSDVTDEERFDNDLKNLASDPSYVFNVKDMTEVRRKFRDIAAKIYRTYISYSLLLSLPAPDPDSRIRLTFDNISDAAQSEYYLEGTYTFGDYGVLNNVSYCGVRCANGSTLVSYPDGMFDIFVLHNLETNLGERIVASNVKQWYYIQSTGKWQINSEFTPASGVTITEDRNSAIVMLVLDCSSSLSSNFSSIKSYAKEFLNVLAGKTMFSKPSVSANAPILGALSATCGGKITDDKGMSILEKGICFSENGNMDNAVYYAISSDDYEFDIRIDGLTEGKTYYYYAYARNEVGIAYSERQQFKAVVPIPPTIQTTNVFDVTTHSASFEGEIIFDGYAPITECGFCWSTSSNPTIEDNTLVVKASNGTISGNVTELQDGTTYYVRAYAKNEIGVSYGEELSFTTITIFPPTVSLISTTLMATNYAAQCQGKVTNDGNAPIIECGFCWGTSPNPTIEDNYIVTEYNSDMFIANITDLLENTEYYIRAYAKNEKEIGYSEEDVSKNIYISVIRYTAPQKLNEVTSDNASGLHVKRFDTTIQLHDFNNGIGTIFFSNKCTSIGEYAFYYCKSLTSVTIPNSVTSIGDNAFRGCSGLTSIEIPNSVTSIGSSAFRDCKSLTSPVYNAHVFAYMPISYSGTYTILDGIESIAGGAFSGCKSLTSVEIPNSVICIKGGTFQNCTGLNSVTIGNSVTSIGNGAFFGCSRLTSIEIPNSVTSIGNSAFEDCSGLTSVTIPNSVISIGQCAFEGCTSLTSVTIPNSVTSIYNNAFGLVPNIVYSGSNIGSPWGAKSVNGYVDAYFVYSDETKTTLLACSSAATGEIIIPTSVTNMGKWVFTGCIGISSVTLNSNAIASKTYTSSDNLNSAFSSVIKEVVFGDSVTSIGDSIFSGNKYLTSVTIPNSVTSIGRGAFRYCYDLHSVTLNSNAIVSKTYISSDDNLKSIFGDQSKVLILGDSVTSIGDWAFSECGISSVTIPNSVTSIGWAAFCRCSGLTSVTIPNSVTSIGDYAFGGCTDLTSIDIPNSVTCINGAFCDCSGLTSVTIPNSVTSINGAFSGCSGLTSVTIPNSVTSIGDYAFNECTGLTSIEIPNSVTCIGDWAFCGCSGLTSVTIPNSVTNIGAYAFAYCTGLSYVICKAITPPTCEIDVFKNIPASIPLYVPSQSIYVYYNAKAWKNAFTYILSISE